MSKLKGLLLTEGMHGMISQVEGLAKALDIDFIHQKVEINTLAKLKKISADADTNAGVTIVLIGAYLRSSV